MTQYARPDSDITDGNWYNSSGNQARNFDYINRPTPGSTYITVQDESMGESYSCEVGLADVSDPEDHTLCTHQIVYQADEDSESQAVNLTVELRQGGTTIISSGNSNLTSTPTHYSFCLSSVQASNILANGGSYTGLKLHFNSEDSMMMGTTTKIYQAYLQCGDAPSSAKTGKNFLLFLDT